MWLQILCLSSHQEVISLSPPLNLGGLVTTLTNRVWQKWWLQGLDHKHPCNFLLALLGTFALGALSFHVKLPATLRCLAMLARPHGGALVHSPADLVLSPSQPRLQACEWKAIKENCPPGWTVLAVAVPASVAIGVIQAEGPTIRELRWTLRSEPFLNS